MEPLAASSGISPLIRPAIALQGDLSAVLREGRVLSGEVLQTLDGGSILIGIGEHRVPAQTQVDLEPGRRFLFQAERKDGELVLRVLSGAEPAVEPALARALRALLGEELAVGKVLVDLAGRLRAAIDSGAVVDAEAELTGHVRRHLGAASGDALVAAAVRRALANMTAAGNELLPRAASLAQVTAAFARAFAEALASLPESEGRDGLVRALAQARPGALIAGREGALVGALTEHAASTRAFAPGAEATTVLGAEGERAEAVAARLRGVVAALERGVVGMGGTGDELRAALTRSSAAYEAAMLVAAGRQESGPADSALERFAAALHERLGAQVALASGSSVAELDAFAAPLHRAIREALASLAALPVPDTITRAIVLELETELARALARALRSSTAGKAEPVRAAVLERVTAVGPGELLRGLEGKFVRALLPPASAAGSALARGLEEAALAGMRDGLKGELARALTELPDGRSFEAVGRALAAVELEQLMNVARREFGEAAHWSVAVPDGVGHALAHFFVTWRRDGDRSPDPAGEEMLRAVVGVEFSRLGPVRADVILRATSVAVRLRVTSPVVAERVRADVARLEQELAIGGRSARIVVDEVEPEEAEVESLGRDIRFLREHPLMDVRG